MTSQYNSSSRTRSIIVMVVYDSDSSSTAVLHTVFHVSDNSAAVCKIRPYPVVPKLSLGVKPAQQCSSDQLIRATEGLHYVASSQCCCLWCSRQSEDWRYSYPDIFVVNNYLNHNWYIIYCTVLHFFSTVVCAAEGMATATRMHVLPWRELLFLVTVVASRVVVVVESTDQLNDPQLWRSGVPYSAINGMAYDATSGILYEAGYR